MDMKGFILLLEVIGTVNAVYLTITAFRRGFMIPWFSYRDRQKRIAELGYHALPVPCFWHGRAIPKTDRETWCQRHSYNVPVALLGAVVYISLTFFAVFESEIHGWCQDCGLAKLGLTPLLVSWMIALFGVTFSSRMMYLMFIKIPKMLNRPVSQVWCIFCVVSAVTMIMVWGLDTIMLLRGA